MFYDKSYKKEKMPTTLLPRACGKGVDAKGAIPTRKLETSNYIRHSFSVCWLYGCSDCWLYGCSVCCLYGCSDCWLYGCSDCWLYGCESVTGSSYLGGDDASGSVESTNGLVNAWYPSDAALCFLYFRAAYTMPTRHTAPAAIPRPAFFALSRQGAYLMQTWHVEQLSPEVVFWLPLKQGVPAHCIVLCNDGPKECTKDREELMSATQNPTHTQKKRKSGAIDSQSKMHRDASELTHETSSAPSTQSAYLHWRHAGAGYTAATMVN